MSPEAVERAPWLADGFLLGEVRAMDRLARGATGEVHRLVTDRGAYAVKRAFWDEHPAAVVEERAAREVRLVERCLGAGVPTPRPVLAGNGTVLMRDEQGSAWRVHDLVLGRAPARGDLAADRWVLEQAARIHGLAEPPEPGEAPNAWYTTPPSDWQTLSTRASSVGQEWGARLGSVASRLEELAGWAGDVPLGPTVVCHRDLAADNTLVGPSGVRWLLDWDEAGAQDPVREVGAVLLHHVHDRTAVTNLAAAYGAAGGVALPGDAKLFGGAVAVWLNFLWVQAEVLLDPQSESQHRRFASAAVRGLLDDVPVLPILEQAGRAAARAADLGRLRAHRTMGA